MARSKPQTKFYINYGPVTAAGNADALIPVFIAPRYGLHGPAYNDGQLIDNADNAIVYSGAAVNNIAWPNRDDNSVVDQTTAKVIFENPTVEVGPVTGVISATAVPSVPGGSFYNTLVCDSAIAGAATVLAGGYSVRPGDSVEITSGSTSSSYGVNAVTTSTGAASGSVVSANITAAITGSAAVDSSYDNKTKLVYALYPSSVTSESMTARVVNIEGDPAFPVQSTMVFSNGSAVAVGNMGMELTFNGSDFSTITVSSGTYLATITPGTGSVYNTVVLNDVVDSGLRTSGTIKIHTANVVTGAVEIGNNYVNTTANDLTISSGVVVNYNYNSYPVIRCEKLYAKYRALLQDDVNEVATGARSDIARWVGKTDPDNPLGMCYAAAANAGTPDFFLLPVAADTDEAYIEALQVAGKIELAYSLFPLRQTPAVIAEAKAVVAKYSDPTIAQLKRLWLYAQDKQANEVALVGALTPLASVTSDGQLNLANDAVFTGSAVKVGTKAILHDVYDASTGATSDITVTITEIVDSDSAKVSPAVSVPTPCVVSFYNLLSPAKYAEKIVDSAKAQNSVRVNYVFAEENTVNGYSFEDARYIVPVLMAMRSAMAPHAPLTDVVIPGVSIGSSVGFTDIDYDTMNNGGVWVCYRDSRGDNVTLHALTTGGEGTIAEEDSAVSNGDNIVRFVRNQLSWLRGNCNVTPLLIEKIEVDATNAIERIQSRDYGPLIGRQIIEVNSIEIKQDPNNSAGVIGTFNLDLPDVYLDGSFTFNLI